MPVPSGLQNCISDSLQKSLNESKKSGGHKHVGDTVASSAKRSLLEKAEIKFVKAEKDANSMLQNLKKKYVCLNPSRGGLTNGAGLQNGEEGGGGASKGDGISKPRVILYPAEKVKLSWESPRRVGAGLSNLGNTCFLNSVLQCLSYTPPLANHLLNGQHKSQCRSNGFCMLCELNQHINKSLSQHGGALKPMGILQKLKLIAKHMRWGRQEDAHEFLRYVVDAIQKSCLAGQSNSLEKLSKETTFMHQVFGGYLRSQVRCLQCKTTSNTYDPVLDISVDLKGVNSVEKALHKFVQPETLDIDNAYRCLRCKKKVRALKQFTIHRAPKVLTVHLKRFDYHRLMGGKVNRHIEFSHKLNLRTFMSHKQGEPVIYQLYGVLVHSGYSCNSGHYYCYIKAPNQTWYCMNDSHVSQTGVNSVLSSEAYILFYSQVPTARPTAKPSTSVNGAHTQNNGSLVKGVHSNGSLVKGVHSNGLVKLDGKKMHSQTPKPAQPHPKVPIMLKTPSNGAQKTTNPVNGAGLAPSILSGDGKVSLATLSEFIGKDSSSKTSTVLVTPQTAPALPSTSEIKVVKSATGDENVCGKDAAKKRKFIFGANGNGDSSDFVSKKSKPESISVNVESEYLAQKLDKYSQKAKLSPTRLMSPPRNRPQMVSPIPKATTPNWQVTSANGRARHYSESESCTSTNSTSEWTVTTTPKPLLSSTNHKGGDDGKSKSIDKEMISKCDSKLSSKKQKKKKNLGLQTENEVFSAQAVKRKSVNDEDHPVNPFNGKTVVNGAISSSVRKKKKRKLVDVDMKRLNESTPPVPLDHAPVESKSPKKSHFVPRSSGIVSPACESNERTSLTEGANLSSAIKSSETSGNISMVKANSVMLNGNVGLENGNMAGEELENHLVNGTKKPKNKKKKKKNKKKNKEVNKSSSDWNQNGESQDLCNGDLTNGRDLQTKESTGKKKKKKLRVRADGGSTLVNGDLELHGAMHNGNMDRPSENSESSAVGNAKNDLVMKKKKSKQLNGSFDGTGVQGCKEENKEENVGSLERLNAAKEKMKKKRRYSEPVVKDWDAKVDDDNPSFQRQVNQAPSSVWDGRKDSNISFLMERHASIKGLGSGVSTWEGHKPEMNREVERDKLVANYKDGWYDGYEQEIDEGRRKKVKVKKHKHRGNQNHFQSIQNNTNVVTQLRREGKLPSLPSY